MPGCQDLIDSKDFYLILVPQLLNQIKTSFTVDLELDFSFDQDNWSNIPTYIPSYVCDKLMKAPTMLFKTSYEDDNNNGGNSCNITYDKDNDRHNININIISIIGDGNGNGANVNGDMKL